MNVVFADTVHPILSERLEAAGYACLHLEEKTDEQVLEALKSAIGLVIRSRFPLNEHLLQKCSKLQFIARSGAGLENIDLEYCKKENIAVYNSPEGNRDAVGEHVLGMLLVLCNKMFSGHQSILAGRWEREAHRGEEVGHMTVGIIGFGNNGSAFANKLKGMGSKIIAYDKYREISDSDVENVTLKELQERSDVISFHVPQNRETIHYFNDEFLNELNRPIYLLNASRGKVVSLKTVEKGLNHGKIKGAGLDVFEFESSSFEESMTGDVLSVYQRLLKDQRVICSPHVAGWTTESYYKLSNVLADKILTEQNSSN